MACIRWRVFNFLFWKFLPSTSTLSFAYIATQSLCNANRSLREEEQRWAVPQKQSAEVCYIFTYISRRLFIDIDNDVLRSGKQITQHADISDASKRYCIYKTYCIEHARSVLENKVQLSKSMLFLHYEGTLKFFKIAYKLWHLSR